MSHTHDLYDSDMRFLIDPSTRSIKNQSKKTIIVRGDHNSERFTFEIPKMIEGHDMSTCNIIQIHYLNIDTSNTKYEGLYTVDDMQVSSENKDVVVFSWLISRNASRSVGSLNFIVRFLCTADDGTVDYAWSTTIHKEITVSETINNTETVVEKYADVIAEWEARIIALEEGGVGSGGSIDVDLSNYVTKDMMPEIDVDDAIEKSASTENSYIPEIYPIEYWTDNSKLDSDGNIASNEEWCITPYIDVMSDCEYKISGTYDGYAYLYDESRNFVKSIPTYDCLKTPDDAFYIRLNVPKTILTDTVESLETVVEHFNSVYGLYTLDRYKLKNNVQLPDNIEIPNVPTKVSELENDSGYITENRFITHTENEEPTYSEELASVNSWSSDGWTGDFTNGFTHTTGNTNSLVFTMPEETGRNTYRISFNCSEAINPEELMVKCGNSDLFDLYGQNSEPLIVGITSVENGNVEFVPVTTFTGTITNISIKRVIGINPTEQIITDSTGAVSYEMRITKEKQNNLFIGKKSGENNISGYGCASLGKGSLNSNTSGFWNIGVGYNALKGNTVGSRNVAVGYTALGNNVTGTRNIAIGSFALNHNTIGNKNIAIGADSIDKNISGSFNVGIGFSALYNNTTGSNNMAIGSQAIAANTTGQYNVAVGSEALYGNTTGNYNVAVGAKTLSKNTTANYSIAIGYTALYGCKNGIGNTAIGMGAGKGTNGLFRYGVFIGYNTGAKSTDGSDYNTFIGYNAGDNVTSGANNICIGKNARTPSESTSNWINIGDLIEGSVATTDKYAKINGGLQLSDIPTTDPAVAGRVWSDNGILKVSAG